MYLCINSHHKLLHYIDFYIVSNIIRRARNFSTLKKPNNDDETAMLEKKPTNKISTNLLQPLLSSLWIFCLCLNIAYAEINDAEKELIKTIEHSGKLKLVYHGLIDQNPPLAPIQKVEAHSKFFYITPGVVSPSIQSVFLLEHTKIRKNETVLDIGSGSGIQSIFAADHAKKVVATDLSWAAVHNTQFNVDDHNVGHIVNVRQGDLFSAISPGEKFDVIIFNIDYPEDRKTEGLWRVHERFFKEVGQYLNPQGRIYYQAGWLRNVAKIHRMAKQNKLKVVKMDMISTIHLNRDPIVFLIIKNPHLNIDKNIAESVSIHNIK